MTKRIMSLDLHHRMGLWSKSWQCAFYVLLVGSSLALSGNQARANHTRDLEAANPANVDSDEFHLWLRLESEDAGANLGASTGGDDTKLNYLQLRPRERSFPTEEIEVIGQKEVRMEIDLPNPGRLYRATFNSIVTGSEFDRSHVTTICVRRMASEPSQPWDRSAKLRCHEHKFCIVDDDDPGWVRNCPRNLLEGRQKPTFFGIIPSAYAAPEDGERGWVSPSLKTLESLPDQEKVGFTLFEITSGPLPALARATYFTYAIHVGKERTPVFIDGWPPAYLHQSFDSAEGLNFTFGLENLNFSGGENGFEEIAANLSFFNGNEKIYDVVLARDYAALRDAPQVRVAGGMGEIYEWKGRYVYAPQKDKYEIFITSWHTVEEVDRVRRLLDRSGLEFAGAPLRGAIRPPLGNNNNYATAVGLVQPTGQIEFTFDEERAMGLCQFLLEKLVQPNYRFIHPTTYVYEMGTGRTPGCQNFLNN